MIPPMPADELNIRLSRLHRRLFMARETMDSKNYQKFKLWLYGVEQLQRETSNTVEVLAAASHWESELDVLLGTKSPERMLGLTPAA